MISTHTCICILVLTTLKMGTRMVETWRLLCNEITFTHPSAFVGHFKKFRTLINARNVEHMKYL